MQKTFKFTNSPPTKTTQDNSQNRIIRGANKGSIEIPFVKDNESVQQIFLSNNLIGSLAGIERFTNLRVLFLNDNKIHLISEIKYLSNLPIETLNMKGNPITKLPYYQHHVVASLKSLRFFDDHEVNEKLRAAATGTVEFDESRLTILCINELRILELEELEKDRFDRNTDWLLRVQKALGERTLESFGLDSDIKNQNFDKMRDIAFELKMKNNENMKCKWGQIYDKIESIQSSVIDDLTNKLHNSIELIKQKMNERQEVKSIKKAKKDMNFISMEQTSVNFSKVQNSPIPVNKPKNIVNNRNEERLSPLTKMQITHPKERNNENDEIVSTSEISSVNNTNETNSSATTTNASSPSTSTFDEVAESLGTILSQQQIFFKRNPDTIEKSVNMDIFFDKLYQQKILSKIFHIWKNQILPIYQLNRILQVYQKKKTNKVKRVFYYRWYNRYLKKQKHIDLIISYPQSEHMLSQPIQLSKEKNIELLEQTQRMAKEISVLQTKKEEKEKSTINYRQALEESVKNENKIKHILSKLYHEKKSLVEQISQSQAKYEDNLVQFMLDTQIQKEQSKEKFQKLQKENDLKDREINALKKYIELNEIRYQKEIDDLKKKLTSAFEVTNGFRMEISRLKDTTPPVKQKSNIDIMSPTPLLDQLVQ